MTLSSGPQHPLNFSDSEPSPTFGSTRPLALHALWKKKKNTGRKQQKKRRTKREKGRKEKDKPTAESEQNKHRIKLDGGACFDLPT